MLHYRVYHYKINWFMRFIEIITDYFQYRSTKPINIIRALNGILTPQKTVVLDEREREVG
jgi:hypothetical protein